MSLSILRTPPGTMKLMKSERVRITVNFTKHISISSTHAYYVLILILHVVLYVFSRGRMRSEVSTLPI